MNKKCFQNHIGPWMIYPGWLSAAVAAVKSGTWQPQAQADTEADTGAGKYVVVDGLGLLRIEGAMMKGYSKFGGASTVAARQAVRAMAADESIRSIVLSIESPGGTVAGTQELADDVSAANKKKPVYAYIEDLGASAAYWIAASSRRVFANSLAMVGSIGTLAVIEDTSKAAELAGVKVHVISTGEFKGAFTDGTPVTESQLANVQGIVDDINTHFLAAVAEGRGMKMSDVKAAATGQLYMAKDAKKLGLIDSVESFDSAMEYVRSKMPTPKRNTAEARIRQR